MKENFDVKELYTPLSVAKEEIWRRWNDKELKKKVEDFLGGDIPEFLRNEPRAALVRYIISPTFEFNNYFYLSGLTNLKMACLEFSEDKFVARNSEKYHLCKLNFQNGKSKRGNQQHTVARIVDFNKYEGKKLSEVRTIWNENLVDFHHKMLYQAFNMSSDSIYNFSEWFNRNRFKYKNNVFYYVNYLALFISHGILFENFLINKEEKNFTFKKVLPSFNKLKKIFGVAPLIVPIDPLEDENEKVWYHYPKDIYDLFIRKGKMM